MNKGKNIMRWKICTILLLMMIGICGCAIRRNGELLSNKHQESTQVEEEVVLTERQKEILAEMKLPTEYSELASHQQDAIVAIEEMLQYAEDKYDESFSYSGYIAGGFSEDEHMRAYQSSGYSVTDSFSITRTETGFEDDYMKVAIRDSYSAYVASIAKELIPDTELQAFCEVSETSLLSVPTDPTDYDGNVIAGTWMYLDEATFPAEELEAFEQAFVEAMKEHVLYGTAQIMLLKEGNLLYLTKYNYTDYLSGEYSIERDVLYIPE